jgi:hypothetical protein
MRYPNEMLSPEVEGHCVADLVTELHTEHGETCGRLAQLIDTDNYRARKSQGHTNFQDGNKSKLHSQKN